MPWGELEPEIALPLNQGENRNRKLASPKDKSSSFHSPLSKGGWGVNNDLAARGELYCFPSLYSVTNIAYISSSTTCST
jgi:hypothetical protein